MRRRIAFGLRATLLPLMLCLGMAMAPAPALAEYHGNTQTHVFHKSSCRYFDCARCSARFQTAREAEQAGYRACGTCKPGGTESRREVTTAFTGNTKSHIFHRASCRNASCKNCGATFESRTEAVRAGYRPGKCCRP